MEQDDDHPSNRSRLPLRHDLVTALPASGSFMMVDPAHVAELGAGAAILFARIVWRSERGDGWRAPLSVLEQETGLTSAVVKSAVKVLRERGWITSERAGAWDAATVWRPVYAGHVDSAESRTSMQLDQGVSMTPDSAMSSFETVETDTPPSGPPADEQAALPLLTVVPTAALAPAEDVIVDEFAGFWNAYPRKTGKGVALKAYRAARRTAPLEDIAAGLRAQRAGLESRPMDKRPHASTWLNQRRWEDDPEHAAPLERTKPRNALLDPNLMDGFSFGLPGLPAAGGHR